MGGQIGLPERFDQTDQIRRHAFGFGIALNEQNRQIGPPAAQVHRQIAA